MLAIQLLPHISEQPIGAGPLVRCVRCDSAGSRRLGGKMLDQDADAAKREERAAIRPLPPPIPIVDVVEALQVGLHGPLVLAEQA